MTVLQPTDPRIRWEGLAELAREGAWWRAWRLAPAALATAHAPELVRTAGMPAGVRAAFRTGGRRLAITIESEAEGSPVDVLVDGALVHRGRPSASGVVACDLPGGDALVEVWLPHYGETRIGTFEVDGDVAAVSPDTRPLWVTYGSSITQCRAADGPSETWPALVARDNGWRLRCLGFGGQCHLDPVAVRAIRDSDADVISLCLGINIYGQASFNRRTLAAAVSGAIHTIRERHPSTPILVISPIASPDRETTLNPAGMTLADVRAEVTEAVEVRQRLGDSALHLVDGLDVLTAEEAPDLLHDGLHPSSKGYAIMADRLAPRLAALAGPRAGK